MSFEPEYETYDFTGEIARCKGQSVVECRLTGVGEIASVLAVRASVALISATAGEGEVRYSGKLFLGVIYEDGERRICRMERGVEFSHKVACGDVSPSHSLFARLSVADSTVRREGASLFVSCVIDAELCARGTQTLRSLVGGERLVCQRADSVFVQEEYSGGELEVSDEFDCEYLLDILMHGEAVSVQKVVYSAGAVVVLGEVAVNICGLKPDGLANFERMLPFRAELPVSTASEDSDCNAFVCVAASSVTLEADEERGKSKLSVSITLSAQSTLYHKASFHPVLDAFGTEYEAILIKSVQEAEILTDRMFFCERVSGIAALSSPIDYSCSLQALVLQKAECSCRREGEQEEIQGVVSGVLLLAESDGIHRSVEVQLPFSMPLKKAMNGRKEVSAVVCGMSVRQKREGEAEVDATLKITVESYETQTANYISSVEEGERIKPKDCAFSIFLPREGDSLWEIAKALKKPPEEVEADNPSRTFPVKRGERIIVYRQKS